MVSMGYLCMADAGSVRQATSLLLHLLLDSLRSTGDLISFSTICLGIPSGLPLSSEKAVDFRLHARRWDYECSGLGIYRSPSSHQVSSLITRHSYMTRDPVKLCPSSCRENGIQEPPDSRYQPDLGG